MRAGLEIKDGGVDGWSGEREDVSGAGELGCTEVGCEWVWLMGSCSEDDGFPQARCWLGG